ELPRPESGRSAAAEPRRDAVRRSASRPGSNSRRRPPGRHRRHRERREEVGRPRVDALPDAGPSRRHRGTRGAAGRAFLPVGAAGPARASPAPLWRAQGTPVREGSWTLLRFDYFFAASFGARVALPSMTVFQALLSSDISILNV